MSCESWADTSSFDISSFVLKRGTSKKSNSVCYIPNLTTEQLYIYNYIYRMHYSDTKKMRTLLSVQKKKYESILRNNKLQTMGFADEIAGKYFRTIYNLSKEKTAFFHAVFYKILLKKQRVYLIRCLQSSQDGLHI